LDTASHMALGTTVRNTLEYAVTAALGFAEFYLGRECQVGLCVYDYDAHEWEGAYQKVEVTPDLEAVLSKIDQMEQAVAPEEISTDASETRMTTVSKILFPDIGRKQKFRIMREMLNVDIKYGGESLREAIMSSRRHIVGSSPLFIIITMIDASKTKGLYEGVKLLHKYCGRIRSLPSIIVFNVLGYNIAAEDEEEGMAAEILNYQNRRVYGTLRGMGATVVNWNPRTQSFAQALIQQRV